MRFFWKITLIRVEIMEDHQNVQKRQDDPVHKLRQVRRQIVSH